ncbi:hypothetical protein B0J12DRAFT_699609 [Macrophomina phaseolina]|uniref:Beta-lactamase-like ARB-00930-like C-terminal domain-containing protein n=1 Tax=Macrophomina phaseolina TaxID=35725 RepID=A0ABQ8GDQ9_9PEZI|nr:hypothetical protein B0J12DRAFT_699609 [Macrophomina phaseolina]
MANRILILLIAAVVASTAMAESQPCPLLGPFFPAPRIDPSSAAIKEALSNFTKELDSYLEAVDGDFGPIRPSTTSLSIALLAGSTSAHHSSMNITIQHPLRRSDSGMRMMIHCTRVYALIGEAGSEVWHRPTKEFVPERKVSGESSTGADALSRVEWDEITLGALASPHSFTDEKQTAQACNLNEPCLREGSSRHSILPATQRGHENRHRPPDFVRTFAAQPPLYLPDITPTFSRAAFQPLAYAAENLTGQPFDSALEEKLFTPLGLTRTRIPGWRLVVAGTDWREEMARVSGIVAVELDFRLYPMDLREDVADGGRKQAFSAVFQDRTAPVDQGTPTCVTWADVNRLKWDAKYLDGFVFMLDRERKAASISASCFGRNI